MSHKAAGERTAGAELDLEPIKARCDAASDWTPEDCEFKVEPDGWVEVHQGAHIGDTLIALDDTYENSGPDWRFVAHARTDIPALIAEIDRLRAALRSQPEGKDQTDAE